MIPAILSCVFVLYLYRTLDAEKLQRHGRRVKNPKAQARSVYCTSNWPAFGLDWRN